VTSEFKRPYDARRRRQRAEQERRATRLRVIEAAHALFLERGYVATTMADIARQAGVALQSVYKVGHSKADLLHEVRDLAVAGDDQQVMLLDRPEFIAIRAETDPERQVEMLAGLVATTMQRLSPVWVAYREAAAVDEKAAANLVTAHERRRHTFADVIGAIPPHRLRHSPEQSTETAWAIASPEVYLLLESALEWDADRYSEWLSRTLADVLLIPES
jgi:AcrR family transcriptional regulator